MKFIELSFLLLLSYCISLSEPQLYEFSDNFELTANLCFGGLITGILNPITPKRDPSGVKFYLFSNYENPENYSRISHENPNTITDGGFIPNAPVKILIHGFRNSYNTPNGFSITVRKAYQKYQQLNKDEKNRLNVILVDWSKFSKVTTVRVQLVVREGNPSANYQFAARSTKIVANEIANLISTLVGLNLATLDKIHIVGHSLGGQIAGFSGRFVSRMLDGKKVGRISALDPAGPCFNKPIDEKLGSTDAHFVDVIHTDGGTFYLGNQIGQLGNLERMGHADFYPNGGREQEGCTWTFQFGCSHGIASQYFAESIWSNNTFIGRKCETWTQFKREECPDQSDSEFGLMGEHCDPSSRGTFFMRTHKVSPYGLGLKGVYENKPKRFLNFLDTVRGIRFTPNFSANFNFRRNSKQ